MHTSSTGAELKKETYKKGLLHYNTKIIITDSKAQFRRRSNCLQNTL